MNQKIKEFFTNAKKTKEQKIKEAEDLERRQIRLLNQPTDLAKILKDYRNNATPGYALLITGSWGAGKTHEITKKYLLPESIYYVSLFGLKNTDQIHSNVFAKMHPIKDLLNKSSKFLNGGEIASGALTLNIGNILPSIASGLIKSEIKKDKIIVFDDFERCSIPINDRLGAINTYVEHEECRVIVIGNDEKIKDEKFSEAKEKLFGITFEIKSDIEEVFENLASHYKDNNSLPLLIHFKEEIIKTIKFGEKNSLRIVRHVINDNLNLLECLDEKYKNNKEALKQVIKLFTALSCEIRSGNINLNDIRNRSNHASEILMAGVTKKPISEETQKFEKITEKYRPIGINITDTTLSNESIEKSLIRGLFKYEIFEDCLNKSILYRKNENIPAWQKMLQMDELDDETTENTKNELLFQFNEKSVTNPGEMLHLFSFMILMSSIGEISKDLEEIKNECIAYINYLYNCEKLPSITIDFHEKTRLSSRYDSQGYWILDENKPIFSEICGHLFKMIDQKIIDNHTKNSEILLSSMINDPEFFIKSICHQPYEKGSIAELPVLKNIPTHIFLQTFLKVPRNQWYYISSALKRRYNVGTFNVYLQSEIDWAIDLVDHFEAEAKKLTGFKKYRLERVIPHEIKKEALAIKNRNLH